MVLWDQAGVSDKNYFKTDWLGKLMYNVYVC